jgi:hypothetical protein
MHYTEGSSLRGTLYKDTVWLSYGDDRYKNNEDYYGVPFKFGCHSHEGG